MRSTIAIGLLATILLPQAALAQDTGNTFRGFRIEGNVGGDRFQAEGSRRTKLGFGGSGGFDGVIGEKLVIGAEGSYWQPNNRSQACTSFNGGTLCQESTRELGVAVRVGYLVTPRVLVFGKGGYVNDLQRNSFLSSTGLYYVNGRIVGPGYGASDRYSTGGYQAGGGLELSLTKAFYVSGQYIYARYDDHTSRQRAMFGAGIRF